MVLRRLFLCVMAMLELSSYVLWQGDKTGPLLFLVKTLTRISAPNSLTWPAFS
jgi:hypothetical protein